MSFLGSGKRSRLSVKEAGRMLGMGQYECIRTAYRVCGKKIREISEGHGAFEQYGA